MTASPRRGILGHAGYLPFRRLDLSTIATVAGGGGAKGTRTVACYDEDTTTMGVAAARLALCRLPDLHLSSLYFASTSPAYVDKTNATTVHAALRLDREMIAADFGGAVRSAVTTLRLALAAGEPAIVVSSDLRTGLPGSPDEAAGGDGAAAIVVGTDNDGDLLAEYLGSGSTTEEFLDRWRLPGEPRSKVWEEKFGEGKYLALAEQAWEEALKATGLTADAVHQVIVSGTHTRAAKSLSRRLAGTVEHIEDDLTGTVGNVGAAQAGLLLSAALERAQPGRVIALVSLADGADVLIFRTTSAVTQAAPVRPVAGQVSAGGSVPYGKYLAWRGFLTVEPPRRPEPGRVSGSAAGRSGDWKFGFIGSRSDEDEVRLPPGVRGDRPVEPAPMADVQGTVATFTVDRLAYSPSPPVVFAVVDFDGGGRLPVELTDVDAAEVAIGDRVEMTFRRLFTVDGIHNYFWKARPVRD